MDFLSQIGKLIDGKKTYIIALLTGIGAALEVLGINVPWAIVGPVLAMLGLGAVRSGIKKSGTGA